MRICFFYRLEGGKTSYEYIKSFIRYLKTIRSKVIYFSFYCFFNKQIFKFWFLSIFSSNSSSRDSNSYIYNFNGRSLWH